MRADNGADNAMRRDDGGTVENSRPTVSLWGCRSGRPGMSRDVWDRKLMRLSVSFWKGKEKTEVGGDWSGVRSLPVGDSSYSVFFYDIYHSMGSGDTRSCLMGLQGTTAIFFAFAMTENFTAVRSTQ